MSSIQQSLNQALYQAQVGAGFYAHSPAGQARFLSNQSNKAGSAGDEAEKQGKTEVAERARDIQGQKLKAAAAAYPTYENISKSVEHELTYRKQKDKNKDLEKPQSLGQITGVLGTTKEGKAIKSLFDRNTNLAEQEKNLKDRIAFLKQPVEYSTGENINNLISEVDKNGN